MSYELLSSKIMKNSYIPELLRRDGELGFALLSLGDELLHKCDERIAALPEKHRLELYNALLEPDRPDINICRTFLELQPEEALLLAADTEFRCDADGSEAVYALAGDCEICPAVLSEILETEHGRDGYTLLDGELHELLRSPDNFALISLSGENLMLGTDNIRLCRADVPALSDNSAKLSWTLLCGEDSSELQVHADGDWLHINGNVQNHIGEYTVRAYGDKLTELIPGRLSPASFHKSGECAPDYVLASGEFTHGSFRPFGNPLHPHEEFCIGCGAAFGSAASRVIMSITVSLLDDKQEYPCCLPEGTPEPETLDCFAAGVSVQYYNGLSFVPLPGCERTDIFAAEGVHTLEFVMPADSAPVEVHGIESCWLRFFLADTEHYGYRPVIFHTPIIESISLAFQAEIPAAISYETLYEKRAVKTGDTVFTPRCVGGDCLDLVFRGVIAGSLQLFVRRSLPGFSPVISPGCTLADDESEISLHFTDETNGFTDSGLFTVHLPEGRVMEQVRLRFRLLQPGQLGEITEIRPNVFAACGNVPLPKGITMSDAVSGVCAVTACDSARALLRGKAENADDALFRLTTRGRYCTANDISRALGDYFPALTGLKLGANHIYLAFDGAEDTPFCLYRELAGRFLDNKLTALPFVPVLVSLRAECSEPGEELHALLTAYIEDRMLFPPGTLPSSHRLSSFLEENGIAVMKCAVIYESVGSSLAASDSSLFPNALSFSGRHIFVTGKERVNA